MTDILILIMRFWVNNYFKSFNIKHIVNREKAIFFMFFAKMSHHKRRLILNILRKNPLVKLILSNHLNCVK